MEDEHYSHCDGLCYDCDEFSWCDLSPDVKEDTGSQEIRRNQSKTEKI